MAKYIFRTHETHYVTYEMDIPETVTDITQYFYDNAYDEYETDRECYEFQLDEVTKVEAKEKEVSHV